jgi:hypothetical protein
MTRYRRVDGDCQYASSRNEVRNRSQEHKTSKKFSCASYKTKSVIYCHASKAISCMHTQYVRHDSSATDMNRLPSFSDLCVCMRFQGKHAYSKWHHRCCQSDGGTEIMHGKSSTPRQHKQAISSLDTYLCVFFTCHCLQNAYALRPLLLQSWSTLPCPTLIFYRISRST